MRRVRRSKRRPRLNPEISAENGIWCAAPDSYTIVIEKMPVYGNPVALAMGLVDIVAGPQVGPTHSSDILWKPSALAVGMMSTPT